MELVWDSEFGGGFLTPTRVHCIVATDVSTEEIYVYHNGPDDWGRVGDVAAGVERLRSASTLICHNQVAIDLHVLRHLFGFEYKGAVIDTLILSRLLNPDRPRPYGMKGKAGPHSLESWAYRLGNQIEKVQHEDWETFDENMLRRCINDVRINLNVYRTLLKEAQ